LEAFKAYARAMPNNCVFLVDTYNTLEGIRHAAEVGKWLQSQGHQMAGIRLDSGDLAYLSIEGRKMLDAAGLNKAAILASNDLDEHLIASLHQQGAKVGVWGVGTKLATAYDSPALGGVYKLSALREPDGKWDYKIKLSEQTAKTSIPGILQVRRFRNAEGLFSADAMYDSGIGIERDCVIVDPTDFTRSKRMEGGMEFEDLLVPIFRGGSRVYSTPDLAHVQARTRQQCASLHPTITRLVNPHRYPAGLESRLHELRLKMIERARHDTSSRK
jgi:nicotinate phosphoribosyltransferase